MLTDKCRTDERPEDMMLSACYCWRRQKNCACPSIWPPNSGIPSQTTLLASIFILQCTDVNEMHLCSWSNRCIIRMFCANDSNIGLPVVMTIYCRMTSCNTRLWLVKMRSRAVRQNSVSNDATPEPRPPVRHYQVMSHDAWPCET